MSPDHPHDAETPIECIAVSELRECMARGESLVVLDVRSAEEFAGGHVDGARNVPLDGLGEASLDGLSGAILVTVCGKGGGRSERAAALLRDRGVSTVRSLCGGTTAWLAGTKESASGA